MSRETELTFEAMFLLEDVRELLRKTTPKHELDSEQKKTLKGLLEKIKKNVDELGKTLEIDK